MCALDVLLCAIVAPLLPPTPVLFSDCESTRMPALGLGISSPKTDPQALADGRVELLPAAVGSPKTKVVVDSLPRREVVVG